MISFIFGFWKGMINFIFDFWKRMINFIFDFWKGMINNYKIDFHPSLIIGFVKCTMRWNTTSLHVPGLSVGLPQGGLNLLPKKTFFGCESTFAAKNGFNLLPVGRQVKKDRISLKAETERNNISLSNHCQDFALDIRTFKKHHYK